MNDSAARPESGLHVAHPRVPPRWADGFGEDDHGLFVEFTVKGVRFVMRWISPGRFLMGSPGNEPGRFEDEGPRHEVRISRGFWIGEAPVTQAQWRAVVQEGRSVESGDAELKEDPNYFKGLDSLPVENVSWHDCQRWIDLLRRLPTGRLMENPVDSGSMRRVHESVGDGAADLSGGLFMGMRFRLPSEAEWEYACRAGTETAIYTGGMTLKGENHAPELDEIAWYGGNSGQGLEVKNPYDDSKRWPNKQYGDEVAGTHRVKLKRANPWGLYDTLGNVWEWCWDGLRTYHPDMEEDPVGPVDEGAVRVARGGSWSNQARRCRAAIRYHVDPGNRWYDLGFRLVAGQELPSGAGGSGRQARSAGAGGPRPATVGGAKERGR